MKRFCKIVLFLAACAFSCTAASLQFGISHQRADLERLSGILGQQLDEKISKTTALPSLLASHPKVLEVFSDKTSADDLTALFNRLVLQTGQHTILVANQSGEILAMGTRSINDRSAPRKLSAEWRQAMETRGIARRFLENESVSGTYEAGYAVRLNDPMVQGFVVVMDTFEDLAVNWRALQDRLVLEVENGAVILQTHAQPQTISTNAKYLVTQRKSTVNGLNLKIERSTATLLPYIVFGFLIGLLAGTAVISVVLLVRYRRAQIREKIQSLAQNSALLEQHVQERTALLKQEIKDRKNAEAALREKQEMLVQTAKFKVLGDMAAGLSHEFAQPLFALQTSLGTLDQQLSKSKDPARTTLTKAIKVSGRMEKILKNVRGFARNETESPTPMNPVSAVDAALDILTSQIRDAQIKIIHNKETSKSHCIAGPVRLQQVVVNIISNAVDALSDTTSPKIQIDYFSTNQSIQIQVTDNGAGFTDVNKAVEPFYSSKSDQHGLGLGLPICKEIIESLGGTLTLLNSQNSGAQITINLPKYLDVE